MPNQDQTPEVLRLLLREAARPRSAAEQDAARRFLLGRATLAEYLKARQLRRR